MLSKEKIEKAKEIMNHWVVYEKENKDKINKADKLIKIQETLLQYIEELEETEGMKEAIELAGLDIKSLLKFKYESKILKIKIKELEQENKKQSKIIDEMVKQLTTLALWDNQNERVVILNTKQDIKQYFEKKVEEN